MNTDGDVARSMAALFNGMMEPIRDGEQLVKVVEE